MRARRARVNSLRRDILGLEKSAGLRPPSPPEEYCSENSRPFPSEGDEEKEEEEPVPTAQNVDVGMVGFEEVSPSDFAEEIVLRDAERGVRLMPLVGTRKEKGDGGSDGGGGAGGGGAGGRGVSVGRLWRWVRGS